MQPSISGQSNMHLILRLKNMTVTFLGQACPTLTRYLDNPFTLTRYVDNPFTLTLYVDSPFSLIHCSFFVLLKKGLKHTAMLLFFVSMCSSSSSIILNLHAHLFNEANGNNST